MNSFRKQSNSKNVLSQIIPRSQNSSPLQDNIKLTLTKCQKEISSKSTLGKKQGKQNLLSKTQIMNNLEHNYYFINALKINKKVDSISTLKQSQDNSSINYRPDSNQRKLNEEKSNQQQQFQQQQQQQQQQQNQQQIFQKKQQLLSNSKLSESKVALKKSINIQFNNFLNQQINPAEDINQNHVNHLFGKFSDNHTQVKSFISNQKKSRSLNNSRNAECSNSYQTSVQQFANQSLTINAPSTITTTISAKLNNKNNNNQKQKYIQNSFRENSINNIINNQQIILSKSQIKQFQINGFNNHGSGINYQSKLQPYLGNNNKFSQIISKINEGIASLDKKNIKIKQKKDDIKKQQLLLLQNRKSVDNATLSQILIKNNINHNNTNIQKFNNNLNGGASTINSCCNINGTNGKSNKNGKFIKHSKTPTYEPFQTIQQPYQKSCSSSQRRSVHSNSQNINNNMQKEIQNDLIEAQKQFNNEHHLIQFEVELMFRTKQGVLASNPNKQNQDSFFAISHFNDQDQDYFFGVCDGHGQNGHLVSQFIKNNLPELLIESIKQGLSIRTSLQLSCSQINEKLSLSKIDCSFSGSTMISVLLLKDKLYCANVGDSRAIIGKRNGINKWTVLPLSRDHKPNYNEEANRIKESGGRIDSYRDQEGNPLGPLRVWLMNENIPGLAMSRSIGDDVATSIGVTWEPEIIEYTLQQEDCFIIAASDGVWEFLENQDIVNLVGHYYDSQQLEEACDQLMKLSHATWTTEDDTVIDDITFVIAFIYHYSGSLN